MQNIPRHVEWLSDTGERLQTADGKTVEVWDLNYQSDENILSAWASHFRNHYCSDKEIDEFRKDIGCSRKDYLRDYIFPDEITAPGPSIRAGDFGEILVADYLEYLLGYWVPSSPAIDAGDPATCPETDQRGVTRPQGDFCDMGAYEYLPTVVIYLPLIVK